MDVIYHSTMIQNQHHNTISYVSCINSICDKWLPRKRFITEKTSENLLANVLTNTIQTSKQWFIYNITQNQKEILVFILTKIYSIIKNTEIGMSDIDGFMGLHEAQF